MAENILWNKKTYSNYVICPENHMSTLYDNDYKKYFMNEDLTCKWCKKSLDLWECLKHLTGSGLAFAQHYTLLGCIEGNAKIILEPKKPFDVDLSEKIGDGKLLYINYTIHASSETPLYPLELNSLEPINEVRKNKFRIIPYDYFKDSSEATTIEVHYCYAPKEVMDDLSTSLMLDSFEQFYKKNNKQMIISAQTAIEILQNAFFIKNFSDTGISDNKIKDFLQNKATYDSQLFILLKWLLKDKNLPFPSEKMLEYIKMLMNARNSLVHTGKIKAQLKDSDYPDMLISAFLMYKYYQVVHEIKLN